MSQISWGQNTIHTVPNTAAAPVAPATPSTVPAPSGFSFSSPAPTTSAFGSTAPAPFGSTAPATTNPLFGPVPAAPTSSLFGGAPAAAPTPSPFGGAPPATSSLFGGSTFGSTPAPSTPFGSPAPQPFGATPGATSAAPVVPEQAAMQAHIDASNRQEEARCTATLTTVHQAYQGAYNGPLATIVYQPVAAETATQYPHALYPQLYQELQQMQVVPNVTPTLIALPQPAGVPEQVWIKALRERPGGHVPVIIGGATALQARRAAQQALIRSLRQDTMVKLVSTLRDVRNRHEEAQQRLAQVQQRHDHLLTRWRTVVATKLEVIRGWHLPTQVDETRLRQRMAQLGVAVQQLLQQQEQQQQKMPLVRYVTDNDESTKEQLFRILTQQRNALQECGQELAREARDVTLVRKRVATVERAAGYNRF